MELTAAPDVHRHLGQQIVKGKGNAVIKIKDTNIFLLLLCY